MSYEFYNIKINENQEFKAALSKIFGISFFKLIQLNKILGLNKRRSWKLTNISSFKIIQIKKYIPDLIIFDSNLKKQLSIEFDKFFELKCYKRNRYLLKLPVRDNELKVIHEQFVNLKFKC